MQKLSLGFVMSVLASVVNAAPLFLQSGDGLNSSNLAVVVNDADPLSVQVADLYAELRNIPKENVLHVNFAPGSIAMTPAAFNVMKQTLDAATPPNIQGYLLTWNAPYRVGTMSITSAFALGYDVKYTSPSVCAMTASTPYFNSATRKPFTDLKIRPAMILGATSAVDAKYLISRGLAADGSQPAGTAYLVSTTDTNRNVRSYSFNTAIDAVSPFIKAQVEYTNALVGKTDVMFYFTGVARVANLSTNTFLPGAAADHLTSYGGMLTNSSQMSSLEWLKAGATASYGTVVEPCNYTQKFPSPKVMMQHYLAGETLIEAYWKSVAWPGEGVFVGEPLARPFSKTKVVKNSNGSWTASLAWVGAGTYDVMVSEGDPVPFRLYRQVSLASSGPLNVTLANADTGNYKLVLTGPYKVVDSVKTYTVVGSTVK